MQSLAIDIDDRSINCLFFDKEGHIQPSTQQIALDNSNSWLKALENAIYDNSDLLNEYKRVVITLHAQHFAIMPQELQHKAQQVLEASFSSIEGEVMTCEGGALGTIIACDVPHGTTAFLKRTFASSTILHHLSPLCNYCCRAYGDDNACLHINVQQNLAHLVATCKGELMMANTLPYRSLSDLAYYALSMWQQCGFDNATGKIQLTGDNEKRKELAQQLRQWVPFAMPEVMPAEALRLGSNAMNIPFYLLTLALYENN